MIQELPSLASDNHSEIHPKILQSICEINHGDSPAYGTDKISISLQKFIKSNIGPQFSPWLVQNGTAANVLCLKTLSPSYGSVLCSDESHLYWDECGAPEFIAGVSLKPIPSKDGKIVISELTKYLKRFGDQHYSQPKVISVTQPTELGTTYSFKELDEIKKICKKHNLYFHCDGARYAQAIVSLNTDLKTLSSYFDAISFGGTKNGLFQVEMVLITEQFKNDIKFYRKQLLHLASKVRFLSVQFLTYLESGLYLDIAKHAHSKAKYLNEELIKLGYNAQYSVESNAVFINLPKEYISQLRKHTFFYVWDEETTLVRLMTSFNTTNEKVDSFIKEIKRLSKAKG